MAKTSTSAPQKDVTPPTISREESASPMTPKTFRNHPDMENFFRFIYDNDLRVEALGIIDTIIVERRARKKKLAQA